MDVKNIGEGKVVLIAGGGKIYTDIAARFVKSERDLESIISSPYNKKIVKNILTGGHEAATEFDLFIFGVECYSRVTEVQLVRKRLASYLIKSGRCDLDGNRNFNMVIPKNISSFASKTELNLENIIIDGIPLLTIKPDIKKIEYIYDSYDIMYMIENWYQAGLEEGLAEEDLRYLKPQATEFKAIIGMNAHALRDWFKIRCCKNAQKEIRDLANKMLKLCKEAAPDLFEDAGSSCIRLKYCPENKYQHESCRKNIPTQEDVVKMIEENWGKR
ncbi:MAG: FAD-dependent thymidylate synthase [archaeon]